MFQSTHPHGVRPKSYLLRSSRSEFQSTHPHGVRLTRPAKFAKAVEFQSTHPHGVRPLVQLGIHPAQPVSIHAPTRGATNSMTSPPNLIICFNPRTHTGCDLFYSLSCYTHPSFNPRTHTGCDPYLMQRLSVEGYVSIHAPTRGATFRNIVMLTLKISFNPRTHTGCDTKRAREIFKSKAFQSTHPHGVRPLYKVTYYKSIN